MKPLISFILILFSFSILAEEKVDIKEKNISVKKENLITETKKGYLDFTIVNEKNRVTHLLDNGLYLNSRIYIKDSDRRFFLRETAKYSILTTESTVKLKWRVLTLDVIETYTKNESGYAYEIKVTNRTNKDRNIGVYIMYDTYLGEESGDHFLVEDYKIIKREKKYTGEEIPNSIKSINELGQGLEFQFMDSVDVKPDRVLLANWDKVAYSKKWPYNLKDGGLFSHGYYSINDSSIAVLYPGINVHGSDSITYNYKINFLQESKIKKTEPQKTIISKWTKVEDTPEVDLVEELKVEESIVVPEVLIDDNPIVENESLIIDGPIDPDKEELKQMLEYIQKKQRGEDVSEYDFDEAYILKKLKERNE